MDQTSIRKEALWDTTMSTVLVLGASLVALVSRAAWHSWRKAKSDTFASAQWEQTLERLRPWDSLKASHDIVVERCGGETAIYLLFSRDCTWLLGTCIVYALTVIVPVHFIHDRGIVQMAILAPSADSKGHILLAHFGLVVVMVVGTTVAAWSLLPTYIKYFVLNKRWSRSHLAARSVKLDGLLKLDPPEEEEERWTCSELAELVERELFAMLKAEGSLQRDEITVHVVPHHRSILEESTHPHRLSWSSDNEDADMMTTPSGVAFVQFASVPLAQLCLDTLPHSTSRLTACTVEPAPEPSDVLWSALGTSKLERFLRAWLMTPLCCALLVLVELGLMMLTHLLANMAPGRALNALPALVLAVCNLWMVPAVMYHLVLHEFHHHISVLEVAFLRKYSICLALTTLTLPPLASALLAWIEAGFSPSLSCGTVVVDWLASGQSEGFFAQYFLMAVVVVVCEAGRPEKNSWRSPGSHSTEESTDETEVFLGALRTTYTMPLQAIYSKPYQYAVALHVLYLSLSFGCRSPWVLFAGTFLAVLKYFIDKVAEFRFFSDPVAQQQVRPRFLRRGGQHLALCAIQLLAMAPAAVVLSFLLVVEKHPKSSGLKHSDARALWVCCILLVTVPLCWIVVLFWTRFGDIQASKGQQGFIVESARERTAESYEFPYARPNYGSVVDVSCERAHNLEAGGL
eukprot:TRINITY_DN5310_c0_g3_i5.p1 TRINITY_DN5310_c0_g3~~TRINITY_DN5310_c0_g3_i5.p1  ORF type:complete len:687 (+),score=117.74 TRINITY_DN5310_c0_g3_i5:224-2284(+)